MKFLLFQIIKIMPKSIISIIDYNINQCEHVENTSVENCISLKDKPSVSWINVTGLGQSAIIDKLGTSFGLHQLSIDDIKNTKHRSKLEEFKDSIFLILKSCKYSKDDQLETKQVSIIRGAKYLISFQESEEDNFSAVKTKIESASGKIRKSSSHFLAYSLIDKLVDDYYLVLEKMTEKGEQLRKDIFENPKREHLHDIEKLQSNLLSFERSVMPLRKIIPDLERLESRIVFESVGIYLKDVNDHVIQIIESINSMHNSLSNMNTLYLAMMSHKTNEVMKVLTIVATIFIPLTFITGVYGMNFLNMPEITSPYGYPLVILVMIVMVWIMVAYFRKKKII